MHNYLKTVVFQGVELKQTVYAKPKAKKKALSKLTSSYKTMHNISIRPTWEGTSKLATTTNCEADRFTRTSCPKFLIHIVIFSLAVFVVPPPTVAPCAKNYIAQFAARVRFGHVFAHSARPVQSFICTVFEVVCDFAVEALSLERLVCLARPDQLRTINQMHNSRVTLLGWWRCRHDRSRGLLPSNARSPNRHTPRGNWIVGFVNVPLDPHLSGEFLRIETVVPLYCQVVVKLFMTVRRINPSVSALKYSKGVHLHSVTNPLVRNDIPPA
jgi:hypothetical protein